MKNYILLFSIFHLSLFTLHAQHWYAVGRGMNNDALAFDTLNGNLYAGGIFDTANGHPANYMAVWNGAKWDSVSGGMTGGGSLGGVYALATYNGKLFAGGAFDSAYGKPAIKNIAVWNGTKWDSVGGGINGKVCALAIYNGKLYAGGLFDSAGGHRAINIAAWNGIKWDSVGGGIGEARNNNFVRSLCVFNGKLYAGGGFDSAGGHYAYGMAMWNDTNWDSVGGGGIFTDGIVLTMTSYNGNLYAGGNFTKIGGISARHIAKWNDTAWSALGNGLGTGVTAEVLAIAGYNGVIYAGGFMIPTIEKWNGTVWDSSNEQLYTVLEALTVYNGHLYAGGDLQGTDFIGDTVRMVAELKNPSSVADIKSNIEEGKVYPNPNHGLFNLSIRNYELGMNGRVEIYNMLGGKIYDEMLKQVQHDGTAQINLSNQSSGIYLYRVISETGNLVSDGKFVIEK